MLDAEGDETMKGRPLTSEEFDRSAHRLRFDLWARSGELEISATGIEGEWARIGKR